MKKLLAWLLAFLTATTYNVEYVRQDNTQFYQSDGYYKLDTELAEPDYRTQNTVEASTFSSQKACLYYNTNASNAKKVSGLKSTAYWFEEGVSKSVDDLSDSEKSFKFSIDGIIVAPFDMTNLTPSDITQNDWPSMSLECKLNGETYIITISGMECWFCDLKRTLPRIDANDPKSQVILTHDYSESTHAFKQGQVIGRAIANQTTVTIALKSNGNGVAIREFFQKGAN